jgi:poly [ADP-ribose] polymerase
MAEKIKSEKQSSLKTTYEIPTDWVKDLNFFDLSGEKSGTFGTSCKFYHIELQLGKDGNCQLYTEYGPTGFVQAREFRYFAQDKTNAEKEFTKIVKSKIKKGYVEIDIAQRVVGSDESKKIVKPVQLNNIEEITIEKNNNKLHCETQRIISELLGSTNKFVTTTLKCPLGQLTNNQIDSGRSKLQEARKIIQTGLSDDNKKILLSLTNDFYGLIPHNLGQGARGKLTNLILDTKEKIDNKEYDLDTLLDAKSLGTSLDSNSIWDQYNSLDTEFSFIDHQDPIFDWLNKLIQDTRASNHHHLGKIILLNAWGINRNNERKTFLSRAQQIADQCGRQVIPDQMSIITKRTDVYDPKLFEFANIIPLFHGTRSQNITGILKKGMLIRPSGVVICGAMYGHALYMGKSSKSINYTSIKSSYWSGGNDDRAFLFVSDCALGNQKIATGSNNYSLENIKPNHSVWARGGSSGVINDEFMLYETNQHNIRYLLEFTCK